MNRIKQLVSKMVGVKGLFAVASTVALFRGDVSEWVFLLAWTMVIGAREIQKAVAVLPRGLVQKAPTEEGENE